MLSFDVVITKSDMLAMFDEFHKEMTGEEGYGYDYSMKENPWLMFRNKIIAESKQGIVEE